MMYDPPQPNFPPPLVLDENIENADSIPYLIENASIILTNGLLTPAYSPDISSVFDLRSDCPTNYFTTQLRTNHTEDIFITSEPERQVPAHDSFTTSTVEEHWENPTSSYVDSGISFQRFEDASSYSDELPYNETHYDQQTAQILLQDMYSSFSSSPLNSHALFTSSDGFSIPAKLPLSPPTQQRPKKLVKRKRRTKKERAEMKYNENEPPIIEQLQSNPVIWEKIQQTKKKGIYKCAHCIKVFPDLRQFALHLDEEKVVRYHKCPIQDCPWSILGLPRKAEIRRHCAAQHGMNVEEDGEANTGYTASYTFECKYDNCTRVFKRKDSYTRHEKLVHLNPTSRFNTRVKKTKLKTSAQ